MYFFKAVIDRGRAACSERMSRRGAAGACAKYAAMHLTRGPVHRPPVRRHALPPSYPATLPASPLTLQVKTSQPLLSAYNPFEAPSCSERILGNALTTT